jgi:hypothetical protein
VHVEAVSRQVQPESAPVPAVKVSLHSCNDVEFKVYLRSSELTQRRVRIEARTLAPRSLGSYGREAFIDDMWVLTRLGFESGRTLVQLLGTFEAWEARLLESLRHAQARSAAAGHAGLPRAASALASAGASKDASAHAAHAAHAAQAAQAAQAAHAAHAAQAAHAQELVQEHTLEAAPAAPPAADEAHVSTVHPEELAGSLEDFECMVRLMGCALKSAARKVCKLKDRSRMLESVANLAQLVSRVGDLHARVVALCAGYQDRTAVEVVSRLEEFVLMTVQTTASRIALAVEEGRQEGAGPAHDPAAASQLVLRVQEVMCAKCYIGGGVFSLRDTDGVAGAEYSFRWHALKSYFYSCLDMAASRKQPSWFWIDVMGMLAASLAMGAALAVTWLSQSSLPNFSVPLALALVAGYVLKDRIKEWVKRWGALLFRWPHRMWNLSLATGGQQSRAVGSADEWYEVFELGARSVAEANRKARGAHGRAAVPTERLNSFLLTRDVQLDQAAFRAAVSSSGYRAAAGGLAQRDSHTLDRDVVQIIRFNVSDLRERVPSTHDKYAFVDKATGRPHVLECPLTYQLRFTLRVSSLERSKGMLRDWLARVLPKYSAVVESAEARAAKPILEQHFEALLDNNGLRYIRLAA